MWELPVGSEWMLTGPGVGAAIEQGAVAHCQPHRSWYVGSKAGRAGD